MADKMKITVRGQKPVIEWHAAAQKARDQAASGDMHLVQSFKGGLLLAVVDGVGHGAAATAAAGTAVDVLKRHAKDTVISLVRRCHEALLGSRGAVMTLASLKIAEEMLTWIGVGNVEGRLLRADGDRRHPSENTLLLRGGLVGYRLPTLHASVLPVMPDDLLIFTSDGIYPGFDAIVAFGASPRLIAERILHEYCKGSDDAVVLVARYLGKKIVRPEKRFAAKTAMMKSRTTFKP
jgi:hypothetical protein